jgi:hypothetical protein
MSNTTLRKMSFEDWCKEYLPVSNHIDPEGSSFSGWNEGEEDGIMFETYGKELEHILFQMLSGDADTVWTYVDGDKGTYVVKGMQFVNRIGYFITRLPANHETDYEILVSKDLE